MLDPDAPKMSCRVENICSPSATVDWMDRFRPWNEHLPEYDRNMHDNVHLQAFKVCSRLCMFHDFCLDVHFSLALYIGTPQSLS